MRTIKFRGKRIDCDEWVYGWLWEHKRREERFTMIGTGTRSSSVDGFVVDPSTVGQFTGLLDKNGKEIYEGDTIKDEYKEDGITYESHLPVFYCTDDACFMLDTSLTKDKSHYEPLSDWSQNDLEVNGNVYDKSTVKE